MDISDFLPTYPNIENTKYDILNPTDEKFNYALYRKKEFYENRLKRIEQFPRERGMLTKYQKTIARYMSSHTPYSGVLLVHAMGTGKTCSAIGAIELIRSEKSTFNGAIILARGKTMLDNFRRELVEKCTEGQYIPDNYENLTQGQKVYRINKKTAFYNFQTFFKFQKEIKTLSDENIVAEYSNKIIVLDEVHNLRIQEKEENVEGMYEVYHKFLHLVKNCKIILLSGTPMKDTPDEIASVLNLILPLENQFPFEEKFLQEFMERNDGAYVFLPEKKDEFKEKIKGYVSFLREEYSTVQKEFLGVKRLSQTFSEKYNVDAQNDEEKEDAKEEKEEEIDEENTVTESLRHFITNPVEMSAFQSEHYAKALKKGVGVSTAPREASLFVYPDGSYGSAGFQKYIKLSEGKIKGVKREYNMTDELKKALKGKNNEETLKNIRKYSASYAYSIEKILSTKGNCFVYSSIVKGSGAVLFSLLLKLFGFSAATGKDKDKKLRYALLTGFESATDLSKITAQFNDSENMTGDYIKVIIGSKAVSEGFSFKNVILEIVNTPHWNYSETAQALARGIRLGSHNDLLQAGYNVKVEIAQIVSIPTEYTTFSIDLHMYKISEDKDISMRAIMRLLMEAAFDCALNYYRNHIENGVTGSRECDYTVCDYKCDGVTMSAIKDGLSEENLDYSTYQLFYANPRISAVRKRIENLFRNNYRISIGSIIESLKDDFSEDEVKNALFSLIEEEETDIFDLKMFLEKYSRSAVQKISHDIEKIFSSVFSMEFSSIVENFPNNTEFEVLTALSELISNSTIIINKYGFPCYLREENNIYFLVDNLSVKIDKYSDYYSKYPYIKNNYSVETILKFFEVNVVPKIINNICMSRGNFSELMKNLPVNIQEYFIEASILAERKNIDYNSSLRKKILDYFKSYMKNVNNTTISTRRKDENIYRCLEDEKENWYDCEDEIREKLVSKEAETKENIIARSDTGIIGTYNPEGGKSGEGSFCLLDVKNAGDKNDRRKIKSGKVCAGGGWTIPELLEICVKRIKVPPPNNYDTGMGVEDMRSKVKEDTKYLMKIFTEEEVDEADEETLTRALYWGTPEKQGGGRTIKKICENLRKWFEENDLLLLDNNCGVQGKQNMEKIEAKGVSKFKILKVDLKSPDFENYKVQIQDMGKKCFSNKEFTVRNDGSIWYLMMSKKNTPIGFIKILNDTIEGLCISDYYRKKKDGTPQELIRLSMNTLKNDGIPAEITVSSNSANYNKLQKYYESLNFIVKYSNAEETVYIYH